MNGLRIKDCGPGTTVQDLGRYGYRRFGVSTAGVMDRTAAALANVLVGNAPGTACIEFHMMGGQFVVEGCPVVVAVMGPGSSLWIDGKLVAEGHATQAGLGEVVEVGPVRGGAFAYLALAGGIDLAPEMESLSVHRRSGIGGGSLAKGDLVPTIPAPVRLLSILVSKRKTAPIRVVPGPQDDHFAADALSTLCGQAYTIRTDSDRMGCRLSGPVLSHVGKVDIVSDGVLPGSIQVPADGQPIILLRDCPTTGGYPKIATVISADLGSLAQIAPGQSVRFAPVSLEQAILATRAAEADLTRLLATVGPAIKVPTTDALLRTNLIDGAIDGS